MGGARVEDLASSLCRIILPPIISSEISRAILLADISSRNNPKADAAGMTSYVNRKVVHKRIVWICDPKCAWSHLRVCADHGALFDMHDEIARKPVVVLDGILQIECMAMRVVAHPM